MISDRIRELQENLEFTQKPSTIAALLTTKLMSPTKSSQLRS